MRLFGQSLIFNPPLIDKEKNLMKNTLKNAALIVLAANFLFLQGCVHKIVTVPVKVAYKTTKGVVKAVIPNGDKDDKKEKKKKQDNEEN